MKKGKVLLYVLMVWLMGLVFANFDEANVFTNIVSDIEEKLEDFVNLFGTEYQYTREATYYTSEATYMVCCKGAVYEFLYDDLRFNDYGEYFLAFFMVLLFYLVVDKKVWKT